MHSRARWGPASVCIGEFMFRGLLNFSHGEAQVYFRLFVADSLDLARWAPNFLARIPVAGFDDQLANCPAPVVDQETGHVAYRSVGRFNVVASHFPYAAKMFVVSVVVLLYGLHFLFRVWQDCRVAAEPPHRDRKSTRLNSSHANI